jgi:hypothetical protein
MGGGSSETAAIRAALGLGITLIDSAPAYSVGRSAELGDRALPEHRDASESSASSPPRPASNGAPPSSTGTRPIAHCA